MRKISTAQPTAENELSFLFLSHSGEKMVIADFVRERWVLLNLQNHIITEYIAQSPM